MTIKRSLLYIFSFTILISATLFTYQGKAEQSFEGLSKQALVSSVDLSLEIEGKTFSDMQVTTPNNQPAQLYIENAATGQEYRFEVLVNDLSSFKNTENPELKHQVYVKIHEKSSQQAAWEEKASYELNIPFGKEVQFSTLTEKGEGVSGKLSVSAGNLKTNESK